MSYEFESHYILKIMGFNLLAQGNFEVKKKIKIILWENQQLSEVKEEKTAKEIMTNLPLILEK